jgi:hypothetical protein
MEGKVTNTWREKI